MRKDPTLACLLNLLVPGIGHIYLHRAGRGLLILALAIVLTIYTGGLATLLLVAWAMYDAYRIAKKMARAEVKPPAATALQASKGVAKEA